MYNQPTNQDNQSREKINLLIVDDESEILFSLKMKLQEEYNVFTAENAVQSQTILEQNEIHIALCDERMPGQKGSELLARIKDEYPNIVRLIFSGFMDTASFMDAINKANVFRFLVKPGGAQLTEALEDARQYYFSRKQNQYNDILTSLKSTATILDILFSEVKRSSRYKTNLSVMLFSIANQKNDKLHSYLVDKILLQRIADILRDELRSSDMAGRLDDNSLLVLLTETDKNGAEVFFKRFLANVKKFDSEINKGLLPFLFKSAKTTMSGEKSFEKEKVLSDLYEKLLQL